MTIEELEQQVAILKAEIEKLKNENKKRELKPWRAKGDDEYYIIQAIGMVGREKEIGHPYDDSRYAFGNYYRTKELAKRDIKDLAIRNKIRQYHDELCPEYNFIPRCENYSVIYCHCTFHYCVYWSWDTQAYGEIYFDTKEHAQMVCDILNAELNKQKGNNT